MLHYYLTKELTVVEVVAKLKNQLKEENILSVGCNKKGRAFVETDWYIYEVNVTHFQSCGQSPRSRF